MNSWKLGQDAQVKGTQVQSVYEGVPTVSVGPTRQARKMKGETTDKPFPLRYAAPLLFEVHPGKDGKNFLTEVRSPVIFVTRDPFWFVFMEEC